MGLEKLSNLLGPVTQLENGGGETRFSGSHMGSVEKGSKMGRDGVNREEGIGAGLVALKDRGDQGDLSWV